MLPKKNPRESAIRFALVGYGMLVAALVFVAISYRSNSALPLESRYRITVDVPNAVRVVPSNPVRIGGVRVGQVESVDAVPGSPGRAPVARLGLKLDASVGPLPADTRVSVGIGSPLGGTFIALAPGRSKRVIDDRGKLPPVNATATVDLTDLLDIFGRSTKEGLQEIFAETGSGLAGRGQALNEAIGSAAHLMAPAENAFEAIGGTNARLGRFVRGFIDTAAALEPVADELPRALAGAATTFAAFNRDPEALRATISRLQPAEVAATRALGSIEPSLVKLTSLVGDIRPGVRALPDALSELDATMRSAHTPLRLVPPFGTDLREAFDEVGRLSRAKGTGGALRKLIELEAPAGKALDEIAAAQTGCNLFGVLGENGVSAFGTGTDDFSFVLIALTTLGAENEVFQNAELSPNLNFNGAPHMNENECEAGNEPYTQGASVIGNPAGLQYDEWRLTAQPAGVRKKAEAAGLYGSPGESK